MTEPHTATSLSLLERLRSSDNDAWSRLVHLYGEVDNHRVHQVILEDLSDLDAFREQVAAWAQLQA